MHNLDYLNPNINKEDNNKERENKKKYNKVNKEIKEINDDEHLKDNNLGIADENGNINIEEEEEAD